MSNGLELTSRSLDIQCRSLEVQHGCGSASMVLWRVRAKELDPRRKRRGALPRRIGAWSWPRGRSEMPRPRRRWSSCAGPIGTRFTPSSDGGYNGEIRLWSTKTGALLRPPLKGHIVGVSALAFSRDGKTLASSSGDLTLRLWNVATGQELLQFQDALMTSGSQQLLGDRQSAGQADLTPGDR
jgi:WD40 repeat protein